MGLCAGITLSVQAASRPNIIYINADDLGVMDVGYNNSKFRTPNIDRLKREGMTFTNGYAPAANCAPSRASVHSGLWGARTGIYTVGDSERGNAQYRRLIPIPNKEHLHSDVYTMAEALRDGGYRTIHLGKYHFGKDPLKDGFEVNIGGDGSGAPGIEGYFSPWEKGSMKKWSDSVPPETHRVDVFVKEAIRFITEHRDEQMFIHFSPYLVHSPHQAVPEYVANYIDSDLNATYASMVEKLDEAIGRLLNAIEQNNLVENTLIVFCSDNGGIAAVHSQKPLRGGKGSYYEGGVREPMLMRWPGKIKPGSECGELVNSLDFYPTFMEVAGIKCTWDLDGVSLLPLMTGTGKWKSVPQFWHFPIYLQAYKEELDDGRDPLFRTRPGSAIRMGKWKLHEYFEDNALELYDLDADPGERNNLAKSLPNKAAELHNLLMTWRQRINAPVPTQLNPLYNQAKEQPSKEALL